LLSLSDRIAVIYRGRLSPLRERRETTIADLGLLMAGHGFAGGEDSHAA
jgi:simple sugar transport system ATP-binding protein